MERTQVNPERREEAAPSVAGTLGQIVRAGRSSETPIPVAAVVSIFDDLLAADVDPPGQRAPDLDDVLIDQAGVARLEVAADLASIGRLLIETLNDDVPSAGRWLIDRLKGGDAEAPSDAAQLRNWLRDAFGQPADRAEIIELATSVAAPLPVPEPADDDPVHDLETIPPNGALMAPLLGLGPPMQASIPTDPIRKRTIPIGPIVEPSAVDEDAAADAVAAEAREAGIDTQPEADDASAASKADTASEPESVTQPESPASPDDTILPAAEVMDALVGAAPAAPTDPSPPNPAVFDAAEADESDSVLASDTLADASLNRASPDDSAPDPTVFDIVKDGANEAADEASPNKVGEDSDDENAPKIVSSGADGALDVPSAVEDDDDSSATADINMSPAAAAAADDEAVTQYGDRSDLSASDFSDHDGDTATLTMTAISREEIVQARSQLPRHEPVDGKSRGASLPSFETPRTSYVRSAPPSSDSEDTKSSSIDIPSAVSSDISPSTSAPKPSTKTPKPSTKTPKPSPSKPAAKPSSSSFRGTSPRARSVSSSGAPTLGVIPPKTETARNRPVVRHQVRRDHKISVPVAPAARRNARQARGTDSIMGPSERSFPWGWMVLVGMVAAAGYYLLFT